MPGGGGQAWVAARLPSAPPGDVGVVWGHGGVCGADVVVGGADDVVDDVARVTAQGGLLLASSCD